jgi:hypothetical protein
MIAEAHINYPIVHCCRIGTLLMIEQEGEREKTSELMQATTLTTQDRCQFPYWRRPTNHPPFEPRPESKGARFYFVGLADAAG